MHNGQNYEAHMFEVKARSWSKDPSAPAIFQSRVVDVKSSASHASVDQVDGLLASGSELINTFNAFKRYMSADADTKVNFKNFEDPNPDYTDLERFVEDLGTLPNHINVQDLLRWTAGMTSDHANDQKAAFAELKSRRLEAWYEELGRQEMEAKTKDERQQLYAGVSQQVIDEAGGDEGWETLSETRQHNILNSAMKKSIRDLGEKVYSAMDPKDPRRRKIDIFIWAGCMMHKDLNAFKYATVAMHQYWEVAELTPPILLMNKDNASAAGGKENVDGPTTDAAKQAVASSDGGAIRGISLFGLALNNPTKSRGEGERFRYFMENETGKRLTFPDVCNTRYASNGEGAGFIILYLEELKRYIDERIRNRKNQPGLNHMENNLLKALNDIPTLTEMAACAVYTQTVSIPYMRMGRSWTGSAVNLGENHEKVKKHVQYLYDNTILCLDVSVGYDKLVYLGMEWTDPDVIDAVRRLAPSLPELENVLKCMYAGAMLGWDAFTTEFAEGGVIASLDKAKGEGTEAQVLGINCQNEALLAMLKEQLRRAPNVSEQTRNSLLRLKLNDTCAFVRHFVAGNIEAQEFLMKAAQARDSSGAEKRRRIDLAIEAERKVIANKKEQLRKQEERLRKAAELSALIERTDLITEFEKLAGLKNAELDAQLAVWRSKDKKKLIPLVSHTRQKQKKLDALQEAIQRFLEQRDTLASEGEGERGDQEGVGLDAMDIDGLSPEQVMELDEVDEGGDWEVRR